MTPHLGWPLIEEGHSGATFAEVHSVVFLRLAGIVAAHSPHFAPCRATSPCAPRPCRAHPRCSGRCWCTMSARRAQLQPSWTLLLLLVGWEVPWTGRQSIWSILCDFEHDNATDNVLFSLPFDMQEAQKLERGMEEERYCRRRMFTLWPGWGSYRPGGRGRARTLFAIRRFAPKRGEKNYPLRQPNPLATCPIRATNAKTRRGFKVRGGLDKNRHSSEMSK